jgi:hypothetical protein
MTVKFGNCAYRFYNERGKPIFVPSDEGRRVGSDLKGKIEKLVTFDTYFYHLRDGGHVAALHAHRCKKYFARVDIKNFFYSVGRNRLARALQRIGISRAEYFSKWSTVKNPHSDPSYAIPYGFIQSSAAATLVLKQSAVGDLLAEFAKGKTIVSVFVDDIAISSNNRRNLERAYRKLRKAVIDSGFEINETKSTRPGSAIELFNCHLTHMQTLVTECRRNEFYSTDPTPLSKDGFETYCATVEKGNGPSR